MNSIIAHATYVPRNVLTREAAGEAWPRVPMAGASRSVPSLDEDPITMAVAAALAALDRAGVAAAQLGGIFLASTSSPYVVKSAAAIVADYLGADPHTCLVDAGAGSHAGLLSLCSALRDTQLAARGPLLVIGSDALFGEPGDASDLGLGAAAAAFVVGPDGFATLTAFDHAYSSYSSVWQATGERHLTRYDDDRFDRAVGYPAQMQAGLEAFAGELPESPSWYALHLTAAGPARLGVPSERVVGGDLARRIGDTGCANSLLSLALALDGAKPGETILAQAYGSGAGTVSAAIRLESPPPATPESPDVEPVELSYIEYAKHRGLIPLPGVPAFGAPFAASPAQERSKAHTIGLRAQRCTACGSLNFPQRAYCLDCRGEEFAPTALPRRGRVLTYNVQYVVAVGPEEAPLPICTAVLDGEDPGRYGGKLAALITDAEPDAIAVGLDVELVPRRGDVEHGLVQYGWKFRPVGAAA